MGVDGSVPQTRSLSGGQSIVSHLVNPTGRVGVGWLARQGNGGSDSGSTYFAMRFGRGGGSGDAGGIGGAGGGTGGSRPASLGYGNRHLL